MISGLILCLVGLNLIITYKLFQKVSEINGR